MHASPSIPATVPTGWTRRLVLISVAVAVGAAVWAIVAFATSSTDHRASARAAALASLTPTERRWVDGITSLSATQLRAAFGTERVDPLVALGLSPAEARHVRAITSLTPLQRLEAFGTDSRAAAVLASLTPQERRYVESIMILTPKQLAAGLGY